MDGDEVVLVDDVFECFVLDECFVEVFGFGLMGGEYVFEFGVGYDLMVEGVEVVFLFG